MVRASIIPSLALALVFVVLQPAFAAPSDALAALFDDYWAHEMAENPFAATAAGVEGYDDKVPAVAPEDHARRADAARAFMARLEAIDLSAVSESERMSAEILRFILKHDIALSKFRMWRIPFLADTGFHSDIGYAVRATPFRTEKDYENYLARLRALPGYLDQNVENMRIGLAEGFAQPKEILPYILPSFEAQATAQAEDHPLYRPFASIPESIGRRKRAALAREGKAVLENHVIPAYARVLAFMKEEYLPNAPEKIGARNLPDGEAYYAALVRYYTTRDDATAEEIHQIGLKEVARIRKEMEAAIAESGFEGSFEEFQEFLRTDEQFYADAPEALLKEAAWIAKTIDGRLPGFFGKLPRQPYSVEPVPAEIAPNYTTGRYVSAPADAPRGGAYWVNTYALDKRPLYELPALTLHEAVPGHHLQNALALEIENAPEFRKQFYPHAFGEGWGLYSEKLGVEMGIYQTPYDHFGRLSYEMWRACRLVIDTGVHAKGWSRRQAIDYLAANTALSLHNVQTEVDRYIAWPGQALAYKMGELTIWELRRKAEAELGDRFDIRAFHDAVLTEGGLPLDLLAARVDAYIARTKGR
ncbi:DUF885 domain-containing protein [Amphiplicatus metriothermophilus]|uniref:Uncharacterized conserved protein, DUF885 familyt n=1 Tax=Amphiplicatus metriothermophilus TaxID=1519374 RepID=A0A239PP03_9PROT|nr:DUF885 family protein [Amphiplicatus metriothermophilus]SNT72024.1 Uncharacterized conserved protein, DUF885 familyt [Amphiplicatus metriothermophilus]